MQPDCSARRAGTRAITVTEAIPLNAGNHERQPWAARSTTRTSTTCTLNGRNYQSLLTLRPRSIMIQPGGSPWTQSTNNIRPDETGWMLDEA